MAGKKEAPREEKKNWYGDRYQRVVVQRNILIFISMLCLLCSIAVVFSISQLAPLKSVDPFVIQVDQKSGITQVVRPLKAPELSANEAINHYFLVEYIRARESYLGSYDRNYYNYNIVRVLSSSKVFREYQTEADINNKNSAAARLGAGGSREAHITSITHLDDHRLSDGEESHRYQLIVDMTEQGTTVAKTTVHKLITIEFKYADLDLTTEDRYLNPIGFLVLSYHVDDYNLTP